LGTDRRLVFALFALLSERLELAEVAKIEPPIAFSGGHHEQIQPVAIAQFILLFLAFSSSEGSGRKGHGGYHPRVSNPIPSEIPSKWLAAYGRADARKDISVLKTFAFLVILDVLGRPWTGFWLPGPDSNQRPFD